MSGGSDSSHGGEYKTLRQITRERLLQEMLRSTKVGDSKSIWKVLIMDKFTVKIMSCCCKMADMIEEGVSLVEDLFKRRQPLPTMDSIYFIQPSRENVVMFLSDMSGRCPLYRKAYVFFSSPIPKDLVALIKQDTSVLPRIGALKEMNLEYLTIDNQGFTTDHERAMEQLFGENVESSSKYNDCINTMATRIATVFASLRELPYVRYRAAKSSLDVSTMTTVRDLIPTKLAAAVWNILLKYKQSVPNFPQTETCELLIVDRSIDQIAPVIHEWTYDAMCHDLLNIEGNKYIHEITKPDGLTEKREYLLEDHDALWLELRHSHIAEVFEKLDDKMRNFVSKNKAAQMHSSRGGGELSTKDMQKVVQALPQYTEQFEKLSLHVGMAEKIKKIIGETGLRDFGKLEQEIVFGEATTKDVINFFRTNQDASPEYKLRLMMIYASCCADKFEGDKGLKMMQLARISPEDMNAVTNMRFLGTADTKKTSSGGFSLKFDMQKKKHAARKDKSNGEEQWQLSRFYPLIEDLIEDISKSELSKSEYACMNGPSETVHGTGAQGVTVRSSTGQPAHSMRSRRTATWATRSHGSDDGYSSDSVLRHNSGDFKKMGQRIFIFVIGGATRSELRVCHKLTAKLRREVILGSTSIDDPPQFITKLKMLTSGELSIDDLHI